MVSRDFLRTSREGWEEMGSRVHVERTHRNASLRAAVRSRTFVDLMKVD